MKRREIGQVQANQSLLEGAAKFNLPDAILSKIGGTASGGHEAPVASERLNRVEVVSFAEFTDSLLGRANDRLTPAAWFSVEQTATHVI
jgi:hypothetical protein